MSLEVQEIPIQNLKKGEKARVTELVGDADEVARLSALGIRKGVEVCSLRNGSPCIVQFGCSRMCLRTAGQLKVIVSRVE
jgi:Fe2+ transport system protein FeoA